MQVNNCVIMMHTSNYFVNFLRVFQLKKKSCFVYYANEHKEKYKIIQTRPTCMSLS